jgi:hypothetical protein
MNAIPLLFNKSRAAKTSWLSLGYEDDTPNGAFNTVLCHLRIMPQIFGAPTRDDNRLEIKLSEEKGLSKKKFFLLCDL